MTVLSDISRTQIIATEGQIVFIFDFDITSIENIDEQLLQEQIKVVRWTGELEEKLTYEDDYILGADKSSIELVEPATAGHVYTILLSPPRTQGVSYPQYGTFPAKTHETLLDQNTRMAISLDDRLNRVPSLIATFSGQLAFNPKDKAKHVVGISDTEENFTLFYVLDLLPSVGVPNEAGRIPEITVTEEGSNWFKGSPLVHTASVVLCETQFEVTGLAIFNSGIKLSNTLMNSIGSLPINFSLDTIEDNKIIGITRSGGELFLVPVDQTGGSGDITLEPGPIGNTVVYGGENILKISGTLRASGESVAIVSGRDSVLNLSSAGDNYPVINFQNPIVRRNSYFAVRGNKEHQVVFDFDIDEVVTGHLLRIEVDNYSVDGFISKRVRIKQAAEDPRGNIALDPDRPTPEEGAISVWTGHQEDDLVKFMYGSPMKLLRGEATPTFDNGGFANPQFQSVSGTFYFDGDAADVIEIDLSKSINHYVIISGAVTSISFASVPPVFSGGTARTKGRLVLINSSSSLQLLEWVGNIKWVQGAPLTKLVGLEDAIYELYVDHIEGPSSTEILIAPGTVNVIIDTDTVESITTNPEENQIAKYLGVTGKFITNDRVASLKDSVLSHVVFQNLTRKDHVRRDIIYTPSEGTLTISWDAATVFGVALTEDLTISITNLETGARQLLLSNTSEYQITWPDYFHFENGQPPTLEGTCAINLFAVTKVSPRVFVTLDRLNSLPI